ncbi:MAG: methyltransferase domain-containing protein [Verrucomicrobiae bacterium]|nr:methyltransferase domain-containing protein [Verrucomicrobiae bacterium]
MVDWFDWDTIRSIVEYGPGTGVFTERIESLRHPETQFLAIEMDPELAELTRRRCPSVKVCIDSVTNAPSLCAEASIDGVDAIVSGLPWASFPESLQDECFDAMFQILPPGGKFATFAYWQGLLLPAGQRFRRKLSERFSEVHVSQTAWKNLPPAFVYRCVR